MRVYVKKIQSTAWADVEYLLYREGEYQTPVAILTETELGELAERIAEAIALKPLVKAK